MSVLYIGKTVHYHSYGTPNGEYTPEPRAAIVTEIPSEGTASLCVLNPTGVHLNQNVPFSETPKPGHWNYIPDVADETIPTTPVEQVTPVLPESNTAPTAAPTVEPTLDTMSFPDEESAEETCGVYKYVDPVDSAGRDRGDFCVLIKGHTGDHTSWSGVTWPNYGAVDNG